MNGGTFLEEFVAQSYTPHSVKGLGDVEEYNPSSTF